MTKRKRRKLSQRKGKRRSRPSASNRSTRRVSGTRKKAIAKVGKKTAVPREREKRNKSAGEAWLDLSHSARAARVKQQVDAGVSLRELARRLAVRSEITLRNYKLVAEELNDAEKQDLDAGRTSLKKAVALARQRKTERNQTALLTSGRNSPLGAHPPWRVLSVLEWRRLTKSCF